MRKIIGLSAATVILALVLTFALAAVAWAASPQDIYRDYATNHSKQNIEKYSTPDLQAYLGDTAVHMYENGENPSVVTDLDDVVTGILNERTQDTRGSFPLTGAELLFVVLGALALVAGGYRLRRAVGRG